MKFTDELFNEVREIWEGYLTHPFVKELGEGTLDHNKFKNYLIQDYLYLKEYTKVFALGLIKAKTINEMNLYYRSIKGTMEDESQVHINYLKGFGLEKDMLETYLPHLTTASYTSYMLGIALKGDLKEIAITILPCAWSYYFIGHYLQKTYTIEDNFYQDWILEYASDDYKKVVDLWINYVNEVCADLTDAELHHLKDIFIKSSIYEIKFWDMAYEEGEELV